MNEPQELACTVIVAQSTVDSDDFDISRHRVAAIAQMSELGSFDEEAVDVEILHEQTIGGLRLFGEDEDGNPTPPMVALKFTTMAIPHEEG